MSTLPPTQVTQLLIKWSHGDHDALDKLFPMVFSQLEKIARNRLHKEGKPKDLDTVGLVNDLYIKLTGDKGLDFSNRAQFYKASAVIMRRIVIDHARTWWARKRGHDVVVAAPEAGLENLAAGREVEAENLMALNAALDRLKEQDPDDCLLVELKYFLGMTNDEIAEIAGINERTVRRNIQAARSWLNREMNQ